MALQISITVTGDQEAAAKIKRLGASLTNFKAPFEVIGPELVKYYAGVAFASQGGVFGSKWARLADSTIKSRLSRSRRGGSILQRAYTPMLGSSEEHMRDSFTVVKADGKQLVIGNKKSYFKYHQSNEARKSNLPRRQMIGVNDPIKRLIEHVIEADIKQKIAKA